MTWRRIGVQAALLVALVGVLSFWVSYLLSLSPRGRLATVATALGLFVLGGLGARYDAVDRAVSWFFGAWFAMCFWLLVALVPSVAATLTSRVVLERLPLPLQTAALVLWGVLLVAALRLIATEQHRRRLFHRLDRVGFWTPLVYSVNVLVIATLFFAAVTYLLVEVRAVALEAPRPGAGVTSGAVTDFYLWHFTDAIPLLDVNVTLGWDRPLAYEHAGVGWLLLLFKAAVIVPVIATFASYWAYQRRRQEPLNASTTAGARASAQNP